MVLSSAITKPITHLIEYLNYFFLILPGSVLVCVRLFLLQQPAKCDKPQGLCDKDLLKDAAIYVNVWNFLLENTK